jgi:hypothetical protein
MLAPTPHEIKQAYALHYGSARTPIALVVPDSVYPGMYRIRWPSGELSDNMVNLPRAKDAALAIAERSVPSGNRRHFRWREQGKPANTVFPRLNGGQAATLAAGART